MRGAAAVGNGILSKIPQNVFSEWLSLVTIRQSRGIRLTNKYLLVISKRSLFSSGTHDTIDAFYQTCPKFVYASSRRLYILPCAFFFFFINTYIGHIGTYIRLILRDMSRIKVSTCKITRWLTVIIELGKFVDFSDKYRIRMNRDVKNIMFYYVSTRIILSYDLYEFRSDSRIYNKNLSLKERFRRTSNTITITVRQSLR